jgi:dUTP pyrophosphatase
VVRTADMIVIEPHQTVRLPTGLAFEIPPNWCGLILPRSSWTDLFDTKSPPIDSDYRGEVHIILHNTSSSEQLIIHHARCAQLIIVPALTPPLYECQELSKTGRGDGAFGSTGS